MWPHSRRVAGHGSGKPRAWVHVSIAFDTGALCVYFENTMKLRSIAAAIAAASICGFAADTASKAGAVRVFASNGIQEVMKEIQPQAERAIGRPLAFEFGLAAVLGKRAEAGEAFDAAILTT